MDLKFEGVDLEYKKAKNDLPESFWETYSAFANTNGGKIILGIDEKNGSIIFVVGKSPMDIMEPILCRKKVP